MNPANSSAAPMIPVSWGEVIDKITILEIKESRITDAEALANIRRELALLGAIAARDLAADASLAGLRAELRAVNLRLWDIEDAIREEERRQDFGAEFIRLARSVYRLNDERARLKRQINDATGSVLREEKSYRDWQS